MKTITFQDVEYNVPNWTKFVAMDIDGKIYGYEEEPMWNNTFYYWSVVYGSKCLWLDHKEILPICASV